MACAAMVAVAGGDDTGAGDDGSGLGEGGSDAGTAEERLCRRGVGGSDSGTAEEWLCRLGKTRARLLENLGAARGGRRELM